MLGFVIPSADMCQIGLHTTREGQTGHAMKDKPSTNGAGARKSVQYESRRHPTA